MKGLQVHGYLILLVNATDSFECYCLLKSKVQVNYEGAGAHRRRMHGGIITLVIK